RRPMTTTTPLASIQAEVAAIFARDLHIDVPAPDTDLLTTGRLDSIGMVELLQQQLHHSDRVESPRRQQIGVGCGHVDVQVAGEDRRDLGLDRRERGGGRHRATTASGANSSLRRRRSIFPFVVLGSSGKVSQRDGSMYGGRARANASRSAAGDMSASAPGAYAQQMATPSKSWLGTPTTAHSRSVPSACNAASISPSSTR